MVGRLLSCWEGLFFKCYVSFREGNDVAMRSFVDSHSFDQFSCSNFNWFGGDDWCYQPRKTLFWILDFDTFGFYHYKTIMNLSNIYKQFLWTKGILKFSLGALMVCCCCCCCCQLFKLVLALKLHSSQGLPLANNSSVEYLHLQSSIICILLKHVHIHNAISHWDILSTLFGHIWNVSLYL